MSGEEIPFKDEQTRALLEDDLRAVEMSAGASVRLERVDWRVRMAVSEGLLPSERARLVALAFDQPVSVPRRPHQRLWIWIAGAVLSGATAWAVAGSYLAPPPTERPKPQEPMLPASARSARVRAAVSAPRAPHTVPEQGATLEAIPKAPARPPRTSAAPAGTRDAQAELSRAKDDLVLREIAQMREIRAQLASNPAEALRLTEHGHREFARGMLYEEREAHGILALARLGQIDAARNRARRFLKRSPHGTFSERVRRATGL